jgi:hypothetical protein
MAPGVDPASIGTISGSSVGPVFSTLLTTQTGQLHGQRNALGVEDSTGFGTTPAAMQMRLFADFQKYLDPTETPFTSSLTTGTAINQKKVEWGTGFLMPNKVSTNSSGIAGTGSGTPATTDIVLTSRDHFNRVQIQQVIRNPNTKEHYLVLSKTPATNTITVVRGFSGTTATADATTRELELMSPAVYENQDTTFVGVAKGAIEYNFPQLMDLGIWVSEREDNTPDYEFKSGSKYDAYLEKKMKEAAILFEKTAIYGRRSGGEPPETPDSDVTHSYFPTTMGGLDQFTPLYYNLAGAPITEYVLQNMLYESWDRVGSDNTPTRLLVGGFMRMALNSLWNGQRYATVRDEKTTLKWTRVETSFGDLEFALSRYIPAGSAYLVNTSDISIHPYKNGAWKEVKLPASGPYKRGRFTGDYTMMFKRTAARVKIVNASVNPADYPNL